MMAENMNTKEFRSLIEQLQKNDVSALERLYTEYFGKIYAHALYHTKDRDVAYDTAMDVMLRLYNYAGRPEEIKNHVGLLITMTDNAVKDHFRRGARYESAALPESQTLSEPEDMLWLIDILAALTEEERGVFIGHAVWEKPLKEIAAQKGVPYIAVRRAYATIKKKIKAIYSQP